MIPLALATEPRHASWWQLCLVFVLALLLFVAMRWQPEAWLQHQIEKQALVHGIELQSKGLYLDGLSFRMEHVSIRSAGLPTPVMLDALNISPVWSSLIRGAAAVDVKAVLSGQSAEAELTWKNEYIVVHDLNAELEVAALEPFWKQRMTLPVDVSGRLTLSGNVQLDAASGRPVEGQLKALWKQASIDLPIFDKPLGNYQLVLNAATRSGNWQWVLGGGDAVTLSGSGQLDLSAKSPQQWTINGRVQVQAGPEAKTIASLLGHQAKTFAISGNLLHARLQAL